MVFQPRRMWKDIDSGDGYRFTGLSRSLLPGLPYLWLLLLFGGELFLFLKYASKPHFSSIYTSEDSGSFNSVRVGLTMISEVKSFFLNFVSSCLATPDTEQQVTLLQVFGWVDSRGGRKEDKISNETLLCSIWIASEPIVRFNHHGTKPGRRILATDLDDSPPFEQ